MTEQDDSCESGDICSFGITCDGQGCDTRRRRVLAGLAGGGLTALSGCIGLFGAPPSPTTPQVGIEEDFDIEFVNEEANVSIPGTETLLRGGENAGLDLPYFCRTGFCGVCLAQVDGNGHELVDMSINEYDPLDDQAIEDGFILTCTSRPVADFSIESGKTGTLTEPDEAEEEDDPEDDEDRVGVESHAVDYVNQQWTIEVPEDQTLLVAGEERGFELPFQCREGWCGQCLGQVDGDGHNLVEMRTNDYDPLDEGTVGEGYVLTCQSEPRDEFGLETGKFEEEDWPSGSPP